MAAVKMPRTVWRAALIAIWLVLGVLTSLMAVSIGFLFDAPGSTDNPYLVQAAWALAALPATFFVGAVGLIFAQRGWIRMLLIALPLVAAGVALNGFSKVGSACGGDFTCPKPKA